MYYVNERLMNLQRIFDQNKREGYLRLDLNENPEGLPQDFIDEVLSGVTPEMVAQYPETLEFTEYLAERLGTSIERLSLVNGSSEGIRNIIEAFTEPGGKIVCVYRPPTPCSRSTRKCTGATSCRCPTGRT